MAASEPYELIDYIVDTNFSYASSSIRKRLKETGDPVALLHSGVNVLSNIERISLMKSASLCKCCHRHKINKPLLCSAILNKEPPNPNVLYACSTDTTADGKLCTCTCRSILREYTPELANPRKTYRI
jgi:hypothetical protein